MEALAERRILEPRTVDEFLDAYEDVEGHYEFVGGKARNMVVGVTSSHHQVASMLTYQLTTALLETHTVGQEGFGVQVGENLLYPDVLVTASDLPGDGRTTSEPLLVGEVLSTSTLFHDFNPKMAAYTSLPSLAHYVILAQDKPGAWVWTRDDEGMFGDPVVLKSKDDMIKLSAFELEIPLSLIYR